MNNYVNTLSVRITGDLVATSAVCVASASRGVLGMQQGIRVSGGGDLGLKGFATKAQAMQTIVDQDKPEAGWHSAVAYAATGVFADEAGANPASLRAARLRNTHRANVIRSRHRSRLR
ncbi:hypothetical protein ACWIGI_17980 [Nocardia sp. NPDC055321]